MQITGKMKILLADDHALFRSGMKHVLKDLADEIEFLEGADYLGAIQVAQEVKDIDLALIDLSMPGFDNFNGLRQLCKELGSVPVIVVSALDRGPEIRQTMECGVSGFIPKTLDSSVVLSALKLVFAGGVYLPPNLLEKDVSLNLQAAEQTTGKLAPRQNDVLALVSRGFSNKEIARELDLAEGTVKLHVTALLKVLQVTNRTQAVVKANALGLTSRVHQNGSALL